MGKYDPLHQYLRRRPTADIELTFQDIERLIRAMLPKAAYEAEWWSNAGGSATGHIQTRAWLDAGFDAALIPGRERVKFVRRR